MTREFERHKVAGNAGGGRDFYNITCSRCAVIATKNGNIPPHHVAQFFGNMGWTVGRDASGDLCPTHTKERAPKKQRDTEQPLVERIDRGIQALEQSLGEFLQLEQPRHHNKVMALLNDFHNRVFGGPPG